jgi:acyl dehydratase
VRAAGRAATRWCRRPPATGRELTVATVAAPFRFPVEAGHVLQFARAIGDPNPVYSDPAHARSLGFADVLAPPTFYEAGAHFDPGNECRPQPDPPWWGSSGVATGDPRRESRNPGTTLHAETHVTYHRHVCAGEVLRAGERPGSQWTKVGKRGGELRFDDWYVDYVDADGEGEVVLTARTVAVSTAHKLPPPGPPASSSPSSPPSSPPPSSGSAAALPCDVADLTGVDWRPGEQASAKALAVGDTHAALLVRDLRRVQIIQYAGASGDFSPQHTDEVYNTQVAGYPTVFGHGMLTMATTARLLTDWLGDGRLLTFGLRFQGLVWPGDDLVARATVESLDLRDPDRPTVELAVATTNQHGHPVVTGYATSLLAP